jgi:hypothetical protein
MLRLLARVGGLIALSLLLIVLARLIGGRNANPAADLFGADVNRESQACWHGLCPGHTSLAAAETILDADHIAATLHRGDSQWCWQLRLDILWKGCAGQWESPPIDPIQYILFTPAAASFRLGDAIALLGQPVYSEICITPASDPRLPASFVADFLTFKNGVVVGGYQPDAPHRWASDPDMIVFYVFYYPLSGYGNSWSGFRPASTTPVACGAD